MRINFKYGAAIGVLAAAFGMLGPMAVQAGQAPASSVPAGAQAISVQAPAPHLAGFAGKVVLTSMIERSARQHDIGIAQREDKTLANGRQQLGLPGLQNRQLLPGDCRGGCGGCWNHCGYGYGGGCWNHCGYGYGGGYGGYRYGGGCGWNHCGYGYGGGCGWNHCGYGYGGGYGGYRYGGGCGWNHCGYGGYRYGGGCGSNHCGYGYGYR